MQRRWPIAFVALCVMALVGRIVLRTQDPDAPADPLPSTQPSPESPPTATPATEKRHRAIPRPAARQELTLVDRNQQPRDAEAVAGGHGGVDPTLALTAESLTKVADRMRPSIAECVDAWTVEMPEIAGRVVLGFDLGADGVQTAWVEEHEDVPEAILGCFSSAVYEQDWPAAPDGVQVTLPFEVEANAALDPGEPGKTLEDKR